MPTRQDGATPEAVLRAALERSAPGTFAAALYRRALAPDATPSQVRLALDHAQGDWRRRARQLDADRAATVAVRDLRALRGGAADHEPAALKQLLLEIRELRGEVSELVATPARPQRPRGLAGV